MNQVRQSTSAMQPINKTSIPSAIRYFAGLGYALGLTAALSLSAVMVAPEALAEPAQLTTSTETQVTEAIAGLDDGTYVFGQSAERAQLGMAYVVLEIIEQKAIGAFYMPSSSFDCFYGEVTADQLDLTVVDSYEQTHHPYQVALETNPTLVAGSGAGTTGLAGFYQFSDLTEQDHTLLNTCQNQHSSLI